AQQTGRLRLGEDLRLEVETGGHPEVRVGRPREAIDAAVLAPLVRIDRSVERDVRRVVPAQDGAGLLRGDSGGQPRRSVLLAACTPAGVLRTEAARVGPALSGD